MLIPVIVLAGLLVFSGCSGSGPLAAVPPPAEPAISASGVSLSALPEQLAATERLRRDLAVEAESGSYTILDTDADLDLDLTGRVSLLTLLSVGPVQRTLAPGTEPIALPLPVGAPVLLWSEDEGYGYVLSLLDETRGRPVLHLSYPPGAGAPQVYVEAPPRADDTGAAPRLFLQRVETQEPGPAFAAPRALLEEVAAAPAIPGGFRQQWGSWYVYAEHVSEGLLRAQIDTIATWYGDLGPWQIVIDAGWYLAGDHPDGAMGEVDPDKFPSGMRALVDYAHERGVGVVLYGAAPWIDSRPSQSAWWVVQLGFVRDHPDWLITIEEDAEGAGYVYDLSNPELRGYLDGLMHRYLVEFDADGILLDMVGIIGEEGGAFQLEPVSAEALLSVVPAYEVGQALEVYRFFGESATRHKPTAWIEGGYAAPPLARRYAHTWRLADDAPLFTHPHPYAGLLEQLTYAALQDQMLGRRAHLGFIYGDADTQDIQRQWLAAAVALQRQTVLSVDLALASPATTQLYREYLAALRPFSADPTYGPGIPPETFSTTVGGTTYLGLLNPALVSRTIDVDLAAHGMTSANSLVVFDPERHTATSAAGTLAVAVPAQRFQLRVVRTEPGVLWGDRGWNARWEDGALVIDVAAGSPEGGRLWIYAPSFGTVLLDGSPQRPTGSEGVLTMELPDGEAHQLRVLW